MLDFVSVRQKIRQNFPNPLYPPDPPSRRQHHESAFLHFVTSNTAHRPLGGFCLFAPWSVYAAEVRLGHGFTEQHPRGLAMARFAADVAKATNGQVKIKVFATSLGLSC